MMLPVSTWASTDNATLIKPIAIRTVLSFMVPVLFSLSERSVSKNPRTMRIT